MYSVGRCAQGNRVITETDTSPPSIWRLLGEARSLPHRMRFNAVKAVARRYDGGGRPVLVIPGFMVHDVISPCAGRWSPPATTPAAGAWD